MGQIRHQDEGPQIQNSKHVIPKFSPSKSVYKKNYGKESVNL